MKLHDPLKKLTACVCTAVLILGASVPSAAEPADVSGVALSCDEAYYATTDAYGALLEGSVVKSYILNGQTAVEDYGEYDEVKNLTDSRLPVLSPGKTSFDLSETGLTHFYFEGVTRKPFDRMPWSIHVSYKLNGVPASAEELAGKQGLVEILIDIEPNPQSSDYMRYNYTLATTAIFNQDNILSLEADGAQVQLIGNLRTALFVTLPGEEQHLSIRVGSDSFSFGGLTFLMMPVRLGQLADLPELREHKDELKEDYDRMSESFDEMLDSLGAMSGSLRQAAAGLEELEGARQTVSASKGAIYADADVLRAGADRADASLAPLTDDLSQLSDALTESRDDLAALDTSLLGLKDELSDTKKLLGDLEDDTEFDTTTIKKLDQLERDLNDVAGILEAFGGRQLGRMRSMKEKADKLGSDIDLLLEEGQEKALTDDWRTELENMQDHVDRVGADIAGAYGTVSGLAEKISDAYRKSSSLAQTTRRMAQDLSDDLEKGSHIAKRYIDDADALIDGIDALYDVLDSYEPSLQTSIEDTDRILAEVSSALKDGGVLFDDAEGLMQTAGSQLDRGTEDSLRALSGSLRQAASGLDTASDIQSVKSDIDGMLHDGLEDYEDRLDDLLSLDPDAPLQSLTDSRNPEPASVQILIRTQEIRPQAVAAEEREAAEPEDIGVLGRIGKMFTDLWHMVTGLFGKKA